MYGRCIQAYLQAMAVVGCNVGSIGQLVQLRADQVCPLLEDALQPQLCQPLTAALEEEFPVMLLL